MKNGQRNGGNVEGGEEKRGRKLDSGTHATDRPRREILHWMTYHVRIIPEKAWRRLEVLISSRESTRAEGKDEAEGRAEARVGVAVRMMGMVKWECMMRRSIRTWMEA
jgi:hypothetical protein